MLTFNFTEADLLKQRGLQASTFVSQPFWNELKTYMDEQVQSAERAMEECKYAEDRAKANLMDKWRLTKELVARIEQFPLSAIEAARENSGEE